ncbi:4a-hydroxytetrahydrobiopterin dehydratase [Agaribacter marinus]|uniref:Putative pterin-4-alpha-carbinolamine dehydratase n=1 Tax=Agaribacter marinus TaxID=1431249 RepID=A0AA37WHD2_9ALTE|nr:4a-hydroxytetrahydrobiopterin dehydratase [Agaribacter marinus]GLR69767.1 putative pterin-4-alpha-carbinolamine dehydratase [Agaribacter marinus]
MTEKANKSVIEKLDQSQIEAQLDKLNENTVGNLWVIQDDKLHKTFKFKSFIWAVGWMSQIAIWSEKLKHHPEWFNVYNKVTVDLITHDANGITSLDFQLAAKMDVYAH